MREMKLFKVPVGDSSNDGHGKCETFYVEANYSVETMRQAYKETCMRIGLQMNHNTDYTGIEGISNWGSWRHLLTEYESSSICEEAVEILLEHGYDFDLCDGERDEEDKFVLQEAYFYPESVFHLFMWFISYSMPSDFEYKTFVIASETINDGWGQDGLGHHIGYGVFY